MPKKPTVLFLNPTMPPRAILVFSMLSKHKKYQWKFVFYSIGSKIRRWKQKARLPFDYEVLKTVDFGFYGKDFTSNPISLDFLSKLFRHKPDYIIVPGWADLQSLLSAIYCIVFNKKYVLRSESTRFENSWRRKIFAPITLFMVRHAYSYVASGTLAKEYLVSLGADPNSVEVGFSTIDIKFFKKSAQSAKRKKASLRKKHGFTKNDVILVFSGQLIERKGVYELLEAFRRLASKHSRLKLLLIGYGQEEQAIQEKLADWKLQSKVVMPGFVKNESLPELYAISDIFVLPSREETWGMVVNEAMACGLPIITSDRVGSGYDLVENGKTGFIFKSGSVRSLQQKISLLVQNAKKRKDIGRAAQQKIQQFDFEQLVDALVRSLQHG